MFPTRPRADPPRYNLRSAPSHVIAMQSSPPSSALPVNTRVSAKPPTSSSKESPPLFATSNPFTSPQIVSNAQKDQSSSNKGKSPSYDPSLYSPLSSSSSFISEDILEVIDVYVIDKRNWAEITIMCSPTDSIAYVKLLITCKIGIDVNKMVLKRRDKACKDHLLLEHYGVRAGSMLDLEVSKEG